MFSQGYRFWLSALTISIWYKLIYDFFLNNQTHVLCERAVSTYLNAVPLESINLVVDETFICLKVR